MPGDPEKFGQRVHQGVLVDMVVEDDVRVQFAAAVPCEAVGEQGDDPRGQGVPVPVGSAARRPQVQEGVVEGLLGVGEARVSMDPQATRLPFEQSQGGPQGEQEFGGQLKGMAGCWQEAAFSQEQSDSIGVASGLDGRRLDQLGGQRRDCRAANSRRR